MEKSAAQGRQDGEQSFLVKTPRLSMPKGGGAIRGIGEKFAANPVTGTGSMSVPIATSPGRSGFGLQLSLSYDSGAGNGPFGLGWSLSLPSITRKTDKGLPRYNDFEESDEFIFSGAEDLVPELNPDGSRYKDTTTTPGYAIRRYRPRVEGLFARIERWTDTTSVSHWRAISKDNITTLYGSTEESRIVDTADGTRIFSWLICESFDDKGNAIHYEYKKENSQGVNRSSAHEANRQDALRTANRYLKRIKYGNKTPRQAGEVLSARQDWMFEAVFDYGEHYVEDVHGEVQTADCADGLPEPKPREWHLRQDPFSSYRAGFEVRTYRLCQRVLMFHHFEDELGIPDYLVRATHFAYNETAVASFITGVTQSGYKRIDGNYRKKSLPPVEFEYSQAVIQEKIHEVDPASLENLPQGLDNIRYQWVDLDGEGLSGILTEQGGAWFYKPNQSAMSVIDQAGKATTVARFAPLKCVATMPLSANLSGGQQLLDLAGDGQLDVVEFDGPAPGFFERTPDEDWGTHRSFASLPNITWHDPNLKFIDLSGDGHADILITEDEAFSWYPSLAEAGFGPGEKVRQAIDEEQGPRLVFADGTQSIYLADMSGDGLTDLVRIRNGEVCYWPNLGYARFGAKVTMDGAPWFDAPDIFDQRRIRLADIDGSGVVDILYLTGNGVHLYFNQSGSAWSERRTLSTFPRIDNLSAVSTLDLLGNGTACLVWSSPLPGDAHSTIRYIDLMGGQKPHLLVKTINNLGAETEVTYAPSTRFYLEDKQAGKPWVTKLPFPVHCVEKVTVRDKWRGTAFSSTYSYHHGYFDGVEREFRGFGRVEQIDVESYGKFEQGNAASPYITDDHDLYQPPIKTITWYHTGAAFERARILSVFQREYFAIAGFTEHPLPEQTLTPGNLSAEEWREAARACKGMVLRQEVFELDVDAIAQGKHSPVRLYSTAYHNSDIRRLQPQGSNQHAVFLVTESEAISYHYELDLRTTPLEPDPRIAHTLNLKIDVYGNILESAAAVYPRIGSHADTALTPEQLALINQVQKNERHLALNCTRFTDDIQTVDTYRLRIPCQTQAWEVTGINPAGQYFTLAELKSKNLSGNGATEISYHQVGDGTLQKRLVECVRTLFFADDLKTHRPFGQHGPLGLPYESYKLALTRNLLTRVYVDQERLSAAVSALEQRVNNFPISGYYKGDGLFAGDPITPEPLENQYWIASGRAGFEDDAALHFYLPERYTDPFGNETTLAYDGKYDLFIQSSTDALGNTSGVATDSITLKPRFDYRVLAPIEMVDANGNRTEVAFDILGMVVASAVKGKGSEADDLIGFNDELANPPTTEVQTFCTDSVMNLQQARDWLGHATARFVYHFGEQRDAQGKLISWADRPAGACGIQREIHFHAPGGAASPMQVALECSDGTGNVLMKKIQAEPDPTLPIADQKLRWIINGLTVLNNKGKPVKQYEPDFSAIGFGCEMPPAKGVTPIIYYDAAGRVVRTDTPDGTFSKVEFSPWHVRTFDANDTAYDPDPINPNHSDWFRRRTDPIHPLYAKFNTLEYHRAAELIKVHADTPTQVHLDSLGREVIAIAHNKYNDAAGNVKDEKYLTFTKLDAEGKPLWIRDARGNLVMQYILPYKANNDLSNSMPSTSVPCYDIAGNLLFQHSMDAGDRWMLMDAASKPLLAWDVNDKGAGSLPEVRIFSTDYDELHRPTGQRLKINSNAPALIEAFEYCDTSHPQLPEGGLDLSAAQRRNLIGQAVRHWDPSGLATVERIDFSGKPAHITRALIGPDSDGSTGLLNWDVANRGNLLEGETFHQITEYDALGRMTTLYNWHRDITFAPNGIQQATPGVTNRVAVYVPEYNERGALKVEWLHVRASKTTEADGHVSFARDPTRSSQAIKAITYNAKGQKLSLALGNGTVTTYSYDDKTFRLTALITVRAISPRGVQELTYIYDPSGNITHMDDAAQETVYTNNSVIRPEHHYVYDALYRLIDATGRENLNAPALPQSREGPWPQRQFPTGDQSRNYSQRYLYDEVGNFVSMQHLPGTGAGWTRHYTTQPDSNRLAQTWYGGSTSTAVKYRHDAHGNMLNLNRTATPPPLDPEDEWGLDIRWDWRDMTRGFDLGGGGLARYHYGIDKQRSRKHITRIGGVVEDRIYLGGYELYRRRNAQDDVVEEIESVHLLEGEQRVLLVDDVITASGTANPRPHGLSVQAQTLFRYQYSNHLGSACLELDDQAEIISYEEFHPYGTSAYRAMNSGIEAPPKRYRYTGMERDDESGMSCHKARYSVQWLGRWASCDPLGLVDGTNLYQYAHGCPSRFVDPTGHAAGDTEAQRIGREAQKLGAQNEDLWKKFQDLANELRRKLGKQGVQVRYDVPPSPGSIKEMDEIVTRAKTVREHKAMGIDSIRNSDIAKRLGNLKDAQKQVAAYVKEVGAKAGVVIQTWYGKISPQKMAKLKEETKGTRTAVTSIGTLRGKIKVLEGKLASIAKSKTVAHLGAAGKHISKPVLVLFAALGLAGTAQAATSGTEALQRKDYEGAVKGLGTAGLDVVEMTPTPAGAVTGAGRGGYALGEAMGEGLGINDKAQKAGDEGAQAAKWFGASKETAEVVGAASASLAGVNDLVDLVIRPGAMSQRISDEINKWLFN
jgi:RHS repeat-associated protein